MNERECACGEYITSTLPGAGIIDGRGSVSGARNIDGTRIPHGKVYVVRISIYLARYGTTDIEFLIRTDTGFDTNSGQQVHGMETAGVR